MPVRVVPRSLTEAYKQGEGDFAPSLVGNQFTDGVTLFTMGNFAITTNLDPKISKDFVSGEWSDYYSLDKLNITNEQSVSLLSNKLLISLNFDKTKIERYVYYGSFSEFLRVEIEDIILKWKGSLYVQTSVNNSVINTVLNYNYDPIGNRSSFVIPTLGIINNFGLYFNTSETVTTLNLPNVVQNYTKYNIFNDFGIFNIVEFTGSTSTNPYINVVTVGEVWPALTGTTFGPFKYHVKPNQTEISTFFLDLSDFQKILLNELTVPKYTAEFNVPFETEAGIIITSDKKFTWPTSDGYNISVSGSEYITYINSIFNAAFNFDDTKTDLVSRRFVSESIHQFDTPGDGDDLTGKKVEKLLRIYGRGFDDVKKYIDGISFANVVTYDKKDNTSDNLIKGFAKTLGFDIFESLFGGNFDLLSYIDFGDKPQFSGYSRELSPQEMETELWRRLVINAWWLFRSKGTRKVLEFFLNLFGINECLISLNEHVYIAKNKLNPTDVYTQIVEYFTQLSEFGLLPDDSTFDPTSTSVIGTGISLSDYPLDAEGFPKPFLNNSANYFQNDGFWWNGGTEITVGNNPHLGPYDYGQSYIDRFTCFIDDFQPVLTATTTEVFSRNLFTEYLNGTFELGPEYSPEVGQEVNISSGTVIAAGVMEGIGADEESHSFYQVTISTTDTCDICPPVHQEKDGSVINVTQPGTPLSGECCDYYYLSTEIPLEIGPCGDLNTVTYTIESFYNITGQAVDEQTFYLGGLVNSECCNSVWLGQLNIFDDINNLNIIWDPNHNLCLINSMAILVGLNSAQLTDVIFDVNSPSLGGGGTTGGGTTGGGGTTTTPGETEFKCWWCPPIEYMTTICNTEELSGLYDEHEWITIATNFGCAGCSNMTTATAFLDTQVFQNTFNNGCIYVINSGGYTEILRDEECCTMRGGTWDSTLNLCYLPNQNACTITDIRDGVVSYDPAIVVAALGGNYTTLSSHCCNLFNFNFGNTYTITSGTTQTNYSDGTIIVEAQQLFSIDLNDNGTTANYCSPCSFDMEVIGNELFDSNGNQLIEECCLYVHSLGATYSPSYDNGSNYIGCINCPPHRIHTGNGTTIPDSFIDANTQQNISEECCNNLNGYYIDTVCYVCPPTSSLFFDTSTKEYTYNGQSIPNTCCTELLVGAAVVYNTIQGGCYEV